jgi:hypothetical protein
MHHLVEAGVLVCEWRQQDQRPYSSQQVVIATSDDDSQRVPMTYIYTGMVNLTVVSPQDTNAVVATLERGPLK